MKKKIITFVLILCVLSTALVLVSCKEESDKIFVIEDNTLKRLTDYGNTLSDFVIPDGVTKIGRGAFYNNYRLRSVKLPDSIKIIDYRAFAHCESLASINIPDGVEIIGEDAFSNCYNLTDIDLPSKLTTMGKNAFRQCTSVVLRYAKEELPFDNIDDALKLDDDRSVPIVYNKDNNDVANDGYIYYLADNGLQYALKDGLAKVYGHSYITGEIVIAEDIAYGDEVYLVTEIGEDAFYVSGIEGVTIPLSVNSIGKYAFAHSKLKSIDIPNSVVKGIGRSAFFGCSSLKNVKIPDCIHYLSYELFRNCSDLESVELPENLQGINNEVFSGCSKLKKIFISSSVESIGKGAFSGCYSITVYCQAESKPSGWNSEWNAENRPVVWGASK